MLKITYTILNKVCGSGKPLDFLHTCARLIPVDARGFQWKQYSKKKNLYTMLRNFEHENEAYPTHCTAKLATAFASTWKLACALANRRAERAGNPPAQLFSCAGLRRGLSMEVAFEIKILYTILRIFVAWGGCVALHPEQGFL